MEKNKQPEGLRLRVKLKYRGEQWDFGTELEVF